MNARATHADPPPGAPWRQRWQRLAAASLKAFHAYASWLVSITWRRFILLAFLLLVAIGILHDLPPFTWTLTEQIEERIPRVVLPPKPPAPAKPPQAGDRSDKVPIRIDKPRKGEATEGLDISIGKEGIRITPRTGPAASAAQALRWQ